MQADPLGLVDGSSVYGYALQSPYRYTDPRGEKGGYIGAITGAAGNIVFQVVTQIFLNDKGVWDAVKCINWYKNLVASAFGSAGISPLVDGGKAILYKKYGLAGKNGGAGMLAMAIGNAGPVWTWDEEECCKFEDMAEYGKILTSLW